MPISYIETASLDTALNAPTATALSTASGSAPSYSARAWVNFNGTGTVAIRASGNVSSITDSGVGNYTVNFATSMPDANYATSAIAIYTSGDPYVELYGAYTVSACQLGVFSPSGAAGTRDPSIVTATFFR
jgi:hypothetical protein